MIFAAGSKLKPYEIQVLRDTGAHINSFLFNQR
jgi:hypothetical protein